MFKKEPKLSEYEFNKLVNEWVTEKKVRPSRFNRILGYKLYNQLFQDNQKDPRDCTCADKNVDYKVTMQLEKYLKLDPLPIESTFKIDMSSMMGSDEEELVIFDEEAVIPKPKRKRTPKTITKNGASLTKNNK